MPNQNIGSPAPTSCLLWGGRTILTSTSHFTTRTGTSSIIIRERSSALMFTSIPQYKASNFNKLKSNPYSDTSVGAETVWTQRKNMQTIAIRTMAASSGAGCQQPRECRCSTESCAIAVNGEVGKGICVGELNTSQVQLRRLKLTYNQSISMIIW